MKVVIGSIPEINYSTYDDLMNMPHLYESVNADFSTTGIPLPDATTCQVIANSNQYPTLQMTYPRNGLHQKEIAENKWIMEDISSKFTHQLFKIVHVQKEFDNLVVDANHIASVLNDSTVPNPIQLMSASAQDLMNQISNSMFPARDFVFDSDVSTLSNVNIEGGQQAGALLIDPDAEGDNPTQSVLGLYGGELEFDNFNIHHSQQAGEDTDIVINYGKNIQSINQDRNIENMFTGAVFVATYTPSQAVATETNVDWGNWQSDYDSRGEVTYMSGGALPVYDSPVAGHHQISTLQNGQKIHLGTALADGTLIQNPAEPDNPNNQLQVNTVNGHSWYPISPSDGGGWVDAEWIKFDSSGTYTVNDVTGSVTVQASNPLESSGARSRVSASGYAVVAYKAGGKIRGFRAPDKGANYTPNGKTYKNGQRIHYDMIERNSSGDVWYRIGPHNWLYGPHLSLSQDGSYQSYRNSGYGYIKKDAVKYQMNKKHEMVPITKSMPHGKLPKKYKTVGKGKKKHKVINKAYKKALKKRVKVTARKGMSTIDRTISQGGKTFHHTKYGWVASGSIDYKKDGSIKPKNLNQWIEKQIKNHSKVEIYASPNKNKALNWSIPNGKKFEIVKGHEAKSGDGKTYVEVTYAGKTGWLCEDNIDSKNSSLASPDATSYSDGDDASTSNANVDGNQVRVVVGPLYADGFGIDPNIDKVNTVDVTSYFKHDDQDLSGQQPDGSFKPTQADIDQVTQIGQQYLVEHRYGHIDISTTIDYQEMSGINADFTQLSLYDKANFFFENYGINEKAEINSTTWDCLAHHYLKLTFGRLPESLPHLLAQQTQNSIARAQRNTVQKINRNLGFISQAKYALSLEGDQRKEMEYSMMKGLGLFNGGKPVITLKKFNGILQKFAKNADDINNWVRGTHDAVLKGLTDDGKVDWMNATMIAAKRADGSGMIMDVGGLEYYDKNGNPRSAMTSDGKIVAENVQIAGELDAILVKAAKITGSLIADVGGFEMTVGAPNKYVTSDWNSAKGFAVGSKNYAMGLSSGQLFVSGMDGSRVWTGNYGPSYINLRGEYGGSIDISANTGDIEINGQPVLTNATLQNVLTIMGVVTRSQLKSECFA